MLPACYDAGMTIFEKFAAFAEQLPARRRAEIAELVADILASENAGSELSPEQRAELERRMADPHPEYATDEEVEAFFARYRAV